MSETSDRDHTRGERGTREPGASPASRGKSRWRTSGRVARRTGIVALCLAIMAAAAFTVLRILRSPSPSHTTVHAGAPHGPQITARAIHPRLAATMTTPGPVTAVAFTAGSRLAVATSSAGTTTIQIWDLATRKNILTIPANETGTMVASRDGTMLATETYGRGVQLWDTATGRSRVVPASGSSPYGQGPLAFSPDGRFLAHPDSDTSVGGGTMVVDVWDAATAARAFALTPSGSSTPEVQALAFSPDGSVLAIGGGYLLPNSTGAQVALYTLAPRELTGALTSPLPAPIASAYGGPDSPIAQDNVVDSLAFSPDGGTLATSTELAAASTVFTGVRLWDTATHRLITTLTETGGGTVAFSPDGRLLACGGDDGDSVQVWDVAARTISTTLHLGQPADGSPSYTGGQAFSPDGAMVAVPVGDTVQLWSLATA